MAGLIKPTRHKASQTKNNDTKKWSEGIQQQIDNNSVPLNVQMVPLSQIRIDPNNARTFAFSLQQIKNAPKINKDSNPGDKEFIDSVTQFFNNEKLELPVSIDIAIEEYLGLASLAASIKTPENLINPITAFLSNMDFQLIAGHRRTYAHHILNAEFIATNIIPMPTSDLTHFMTQWHENEDRLNLTLAEQLTNIQHIVSAWENKTSDTISITKLMNLLNFKKTRASWCLAVIKEMSEINEFKNLIADGYINSLELSFLLTTLSSLKQKRNIYNILLEKKPLPFSELKALIQKEKGVRTPGTSKTVTPTTSAAHKLPKKVFVKKVLKLVEKLNTGNQTLPDIDKIDFTSKKEIKILWDKLYNLVIEEI